MSRREKHQEQPEGETADGVPAVASPSESPAPVKPKAQKPKPQSGKNAEAGAISALGDIGKILAEGVKSAPIPAAIVLILVVAAVVAVIGAAGGFVEALYLFFGLALASLFGIYRVFSLGRSVQQQQLREAFQPQLPEAERRMQIERSREGLVSQLSDVEQRYILTFLEKIAEEVAQSLQMPPSQVRANLFEPVAHGMLKIVPELTVHMEGSEELTLSIPEGYGSAGRCFRRGVPNIAILDGDWGQDKLADEEMRKLHPDLCWIISIPIFLQASDPRPIVILNVDGLKRRSAKSELESVTKNLLHWSTLVQMVLLKTSVGKETT